MSNFVLYEKMGVKNAVVIGAGIGGIATSIRLAAKGFKVKVMEASDSPGGKLSEFYLKNYRFDFGPSLFTLPYLVDELFELADRDPRKYFNYDRLTVSCNYFYEDGLEINAFADSNKLGNEIEQKTGVGPSVIQKYFDHSNLIYYYTKPVFLDKSLHKFSSYLNHETVKAIAKAHEYDLMDSMHEANKKRLKEPHLVQLFDRYATYNGSSPYKAPGILNLIPTLEHLEGSYFPLGGMFQITESLIKLAQELGVEFHYNEPVVEIITKDNEATGIRTEKSEIFANIVVSNMDVYFTYNKLLKDIAIPKRVLTQERSSSALVFYWGVKKTFDKLGLHNIFFSKDYEQEFDHLFENGDIYEDPTVYINITSKLNPSDAPKECENWFVMINAPSNNQQNWHQMIESTKANVLAKLNRMLNTDLSELIECEEVTDPVIIERKTNSYKGSLYGTSSNSKMAAFFRHPNFKRKLKNLYFCGGSVHPGGGIPLCLMSAKIVDSLV